VNDSQFISALVPARLREELSRSARLHDRSLSAEIRTALKLHLGVEDPGSLPPLTPDEPAPQVARVPEEIEPAVEARRQRAGQREVA
jgi:hypothetical protein